MTVFWWYLLAGQIGVLNMILWGVYGDLLAEDFSIIKVLRSVVAGLGGSVFLFVLNQNLPLLIVTLSVIFFDRAFTEIYKALLRSEKQSKYIIPSDWGIHIPLIIRKFSGLSLLFILMLLFTWSDIKFNKVTLIIFSGFFIAIGGMLKDAPHEGFYLRKFLRSPCVTLGVGCFLAVFYPTIENKYYLLALMGGESVVSEFYKKILRGRIPGKFKTNKLNRKWKQIRSVILPFYGIDATALIALALMS